MKFESCEFLGSAPTALLVVDMRRFFIHPAHNFGELLEDIYPNGLVTYYHRVESLVIPNIRRLLDRFRSRGDSVIFTKFGYFVTTGEIYRDGHGGTTMWAWMFWGRRFTPDW